MENIIAIKKTGTSEASVTKRIKKYLDAKKKRERLWYWKASDRFTAGIPDFIGVYEGRFWALEIKRPGKKPRKLQAFVIAKIVAAGGAADWVDSEEGARSFFDSMFPFQRLD